MTHPSPDARDIIAAHRLEAHAGWKAGTAGFRAAWNDVTAIRDRLEAIA